MNFIRRLTRTAAALILVMLWLCPVPQALAHAALQASEPADGAIVAAPPGRFILSFNEPVSIFSLRLVTPDGHIVSLEDMRAEGNAIMIPAPAHLQQGTHVLSWKVVSLDGHPIGGTVVFSVGNPSPRPELGSDQAAEGLSLAIWFNRFALYISLFCGIGGVFFQSWIAKGSRLPPPIPLILASCLFLTPAAAAISIGLLGLDALDAPWPGFLSTAVWSAGLATTYAVTAGLAALSALLALAATQLKPRALAALSLATVAVAIASSGHAVSASPQWLTRPAVLIHVACLTLWIGSLPPLLAVYGPRHPNRNTLLRRFSRVMPFPLAALILSGGTLAFIQIPELSQIWSTPYGLVLCLKLSFVAILLGLAAYNRFSLTPRLMAGSQQVDSALARSVAVEIGLVAVILGTVALWRFTPPPRTLEPVLPSIEIHMHGAEAMALVSISSGRVGANKFAFTLLNPDSSPMDAKAVQLTILNPAAGIEPIRREAVKAGDGRWQVDQIYLPLAGTWTVRLDILVSDFKSVRLEGELSVAP